MFERFTRDARGVVVRAQDEARDLGHGWIGTEHLRLAALGDESSPVAAALRDIGLTSDKVRSEVRRQLGPVDDSAALAGIGIDLDEVRRQVEDQFGPGALDGPCEDTASRRSLRRLGRRSPGAGRLTAPGPGHIPFTRGAKKSLELALREAVAAKSREIRAEHLVLGMMREDGLATRAVSNLGVPPETVRRTVLTLGRAA